MDSSISIFIGLGFFMGFSGLSFFLQKKLTKFLEPGQVMIINTLGSGEREVAYANARIIPFRQSWSILDVRLKTLQIDCSGPKALECHDGLADLKASFVIRVGKNPADILRVASEIGVEAASDPEVLKRFFEAPFLDAIRIAAASSSFSELDHHREAFRAEVIEIIGKDLRGFELEEVRIDSLVRQTSVVESSAQSRVQELEAKLRALGVAP